MKRRSKKQFAKNLNKKLEVIEKKHRAKFDLFFYGLSSRVKKNGKLKTTKEDIKKLEKLFKNYYSEISEITLKQTNIELKHLSKQKNKYKKIVVPLVTTELGFRAKTEAKRKVRNYRNYINKSIKKTNIDISSQKDFKKLVRKKSKAFNNTHVRTVIQTDSIKVANEQRLEVFNESTIVKGLQFLAVTDNFTTEICSQRHRLVFKLDSNVLFELQPPLHYNCRSILSPVTIFEKKVVVMQDHKIKRMNLPKPQFNKNPA